LHRLLPGTIFGRPTAFQLAQRSTTFRSISLLKDIGKDKHIHIASQKKDGKRTEGKTTTKRELKSKSRLRCFAQAALQENRIFKLKRQPVTLRREQRGSAS
jgi:hypothetical protein